MDNLDEKKDTLNTETQKQNNQEIKTNNFSIAPLTISFLVEAFIAFLSVVGVPLSFNGEHIGREYGYSVLIIFSLIPILPVTALFQIIFIMKNNDKISSDDKIFIKFAILIFFAVIAFSTFVNEGR